MNICGHVSLVYVNIRNVGHGTGIDVLSHAGTGGFLLFDTLDFTSFSMGWEPFLLLLFFMTFLHVSLIMNMQHGTGVNVLLPTSGFLLFETLTFCL